MKHLLVILLITALSFAQHPNKSEIVGSGNYFYGEGVSFDANEARDNALAELTAQIAVKVSSSFEEKIQETSKGVEENTQKILNTYSNATLQNVHMLKNPTPDGQIKVMCYLKKIEVEKIFNERKELIRQLYKEAGKYTSQYNTAYALKLYYFAAILMNSLPDQNVVYNNINFTTQIPAKINQLILDTGFEFLEGRMISDKEREVTLAVMLKGEPVSLLDFTFWDGTNQVFVQARDGLASIRLLGASVKFETLKLNIKYAYYEAREEYTQIADLWQLVNRPTFACTQDVDLKKKKTLASIFKKPEIAASEFNIQLNFQAKDAPEMAISNNTLKLLNTLESGKVEKAYTDDPFLHNKLADYMKHNHASPIDRNISSIVNQTENGWELRRIRMLHQYSSISRQSTEYLVLDFDSEGTLQDFNIAVNEFLYKKFAREGEYGNDWGNRQEIVKFLEKYRTAYMTRDIETVDMMFAEDALIIVGRQIKKKKLSPDMIKYQQLANEPDYEYLTLKKDEYLKRQRQIFRMQRDILLDFASFNIIRKNNAPDVYGVEMRQNYSSSTYSDEGYLFLLIDFADIDPLIYVRVWQPDTWNEDELIKTANFKIYK